jgi:hypothetical protein
MPSRLAAGDPGATPLPKGGPRASAATYLALALWLAVANGAFAAELVERVLAVVDGRPLCLSDVRAVEQLDGLGRADALERLIDETLLFREAFRMPQSGTTAPEEASPKLVGGNGSVRRALHRRAAIRRYVALRFRPQVRIEDEAVRHAYEETFGRGSGATEETPSYESVAADIRERLLAREVANRVADWVHDLRAGAEVRYNPPD